jgi:Putative prokaryotic signal transducing protein
MTDGTDLVEVAYVPDRAQAEMVKGFLESNGIPSLLQQTGVNGPLIGAGLLPDAPQRVMVDASRAEAARRLIDEAAAGAYDQGEWDTANAAHLADAEGRRVRNYGIVGGYARIWILSFAAMAAAFGVFLLLRAL